MQTTVDTTDEKPKIIASAAAGAMSASFDKKKRKQDGFKMSGGERGGGSGGRRRKRWRPEEIDPMIAAEDAEIKVRASCNVPRSPRISLSASTSVGVPHRMGSLTNGRFAKCPDLSAVLADDLPRLSTAATGAIAGYRRTQRQEEAC